MTDGSKTLGLVGEEHGKIDSDEETENWNKVGIDVRYEAADIEVEGEGGEVETIVPDAMPQKILFSWAKYREVLFKDGWGVGDFDYMRDTLFDWIDYYSGQWIERGNKLLIISMLNDSKDMINNLFNEAEALLVASSDPYLRFTPEDSMDQINLIDKQIEDMRTSFFEGESGKGKGNSKSYHVGRSVNMMRGANQLAEKRDSLIYKVGDGHIQDIKSGRAKLPDEELSEKIALREGKQYVAEYEEMLKLMDD